MTIHLYAEHLVNIRTLSISASLGTASSENTEVALATDGTALSVTHEGHTVSIELPVQIPSGHDKAPLQVPRVPAKQLSFRVQLEEKPDSDFLRGDPDHGGGDVIPWTAMSLTPSTEISCRSCNAVLLARDKIRAWKDLPSENWAEMMDFWHCHRPDVPHAHDHKIPLKGYSADSRLVIQSGVGMVDPVDFVFAPEDCTNLTPVSLPHADSEDEVLQCSQCNTAVGHVHSSSDGYKLRKLHLSLSLAPNQPPVSYEAEKWLSCHLLSSIESQGVRKFRIHSTDSKDTPLKIWVFTPDITISSSEARDSKPMRAVKIFWIAADPSQPRDDGKLNQQTLSEGELELPVEEKKVLRQTFIHSSMLLPEGSRKFQHWNVALLARFTEADVEVYTSKVPVRGFQNPE